ncbi:MAG: ATP-binding protein [Victivallaceae bacterium]|nr:ATP-binding protein [Victivallaceae bacterium]
MRITRDIYLEKLKRGIGNGMIKVITGVRRCGKSYLLFELFREYLASIGTDESHIIEVALDDRTNAALRDPDAMMAYVKSRITDSGRYFILLDEVQYMADFEDVLNSFLHIRNAEVYVTGSNSHFLSTDIVTEFRGRGFEIQMHPLCFREFVSAFNGNEDDAWDMYFNYGGMPALFNLPSVSDKIAYLGQLFQQVYIKDILERHAIRNLDEFDELLDIIASSVGSLTNPSKLTRAFASMKNKKIDPKTLRLYLKYFKEAFLVNSARRYDIKGKKYINSLQKYYYEDVGLRNIRLGLRQQDPGHIMENILYNELRVRGCSVDVGVVELRETDGDVKQKRKQLEVDFVVNRGSERIYIQSAFSIPHEEKRAQEVRPLERIGDSFRKIIVVHDNISARRDASGITTVGIRKFLLDGDSLEL